MPFFKSKKPVKEENKSKLERKLVLAEDDPEPVFDLSCCGAKVVPGKVYSMCEVMQKQVLLLYDNNIKDLKGAGDLKSLSQLRVLDLHKNLISEVPDEIRFLTSLQILNLSHNQLKTIPKSIHQLQSLQTLNLQGNKLKTLPDEIGKMKSLRTLNISQNNVAKLPVSLAKVRTLENLIVDVDIIIFPSKEIASAGTDAMMKTLCSSAGIEYLPPSMFLLPVLLDSGLNNKFPGASYALQEDDIVEKRIQDIDREMEKMLEKLAVEEQMRQAKEEEEFLIAMNKKGQADLLKAMSEEDTITTEKLLMEQNKKDKEKDNTLIALANEEEQVNSRVAALLQMNDKSQMAEQLLDEMEKDRIAMENLVKVTQEDTENLRRKEVLENMKALLHSEQLQQKMLSDYHEMQNAATNEALESVVDESRRIDTLLSEKDKDHSDLVKNIADEEHAQMEAFRFLQLQTDDKHTRITNKLELLERELQELSYLEMEHKNERANDEVRLLESNRQALTDMFVQLMEERDKREDELSKRVVELEEARRGEIEDYWLIQFQKLLDQKPETLILKEHGCDEQVSDVLTEADAQDFIANFARNKITWKILRDMKDEDLKKIDIHEYGIRWKILKAVQTRIEEENRAEDKTKRLESNDLPKQASVRTLTPSAPPQESIEVHEENPCVICMEAKRDVLFLVCGHVCCCYNCSSDLKDCPMCRQTIVKKIKMFMV